MLDIKLVSQAAQRSLKQVRKVELLRAARQRLQFVPQTSFIADCIGQAMFGAHANQKQEMSKDVRKLDDADHGVSEQKLDTRLRNLAVSNWSVLLHCLTKASRADGDSPCPAHSGTQDSKGVSARLTGFRNQSLQLGQHLAGGEPVSGKKLV